MSIFIIGINHKTASLALREKIYFPLDKLGLYLQDLLGCGYAEEAVLFSTCNRSELYCFTDHIQAVCDWFYGQTILPRDILESAIYTYHAEEAVAHMMHVACGLDSMVLGEPQVLGQMKEAFSESCAAGAVGTLFHRLFQRIFTVAKEIRTTTDVGACPVSMVSAAVSLAKQQFPGLHDAHVTLIGAGETAQLLLRYLKLHLTKPITLVNRSVEKAGTLIKEYGGMVCGFHQLTSTLARADVVFSATGSAMPIIHLSMMQEAMQAREKRPILLMDIAVPRDIDEAVAALPNVQLYGIDDLKGIIEKNRQGREHAADKAREMIREKTREFMLELQSIHTVTHTIRAYREQIEDICHTELIKAKQQLHQGVDPAKVLDLFTQAVTKKLLHTPSVQLRQAGVEGRFDLLHLAKQLFALPDSEIERL